MVSATAKSFNCIIFTIKFKLYQVYGRNLYSKLKFIALNVLTVSWRTFLAISARTGATWQVTFFSSLVQRIAQARMWTEYNSNEGKTETRIMLFTAAACVDYILNTRIVHNFQKQNVMVATSLQMHLNFLITKLSGAL